MMADVRSPLKLALEGLTMVSLWESCTNNRTGSIREGKMKYIRCERRVIPQSGIIFLSNMLLTQDFYLLKTHACVQSLSAPMMCHADSSHRVGGTF